MLRKYDNTTLFTPDIYWKSTFKGKKKYWNNATKVQKYYPPTIGTFEKVLLKLKKELLAILPFSTFIV